ncbi:MAG TPA: beta-galactosidase [Armatimonadota bacterium]|nr:beta-galactosidase [Armatimonadota bacterium]
MMMRCLLVIWLLPACAMAAEDTNRALAHRYARAIVALSDLRDCVDQLERLDLYARDSGARRPRLDGLRAQHETLSADLQTTASLPAYREFNYDDISARLRRCRSQAQRERDRAVRNLATDWHEPTPPVDRGPVLASTDKRAVRERFLIFPLLLSGKRDYYATDQDWELLRIFGFEAICPWVGNWAYDQPEPGQSVDDVMAARIAVLDSLIGRNATEGLKTSIWVEPEDIVWALEAELGPEVYLHAADGTHYRRSRIHNSVNIFHPEVRRQLQRFMTALGEHYRDNANVLCYELFEEPALVLSDPKPEPGGALSRQPAGYSDAARDAFCRWLSAKHETIDALNESWGAEHESFDVIEPPTKLAGEGMNAAAVGDFSRFRNESHAEFFAGLVAALQVADPVHAVVPQYLPMFYANRSSGNDPFLMGDAGWDFHATHDWPGQGPAWETAVTYSAAHWAGVALWNEEYIWSNWIRREQGEEALWAGTRSGVWRQFAWGKRALELFSWEAGWETEFEGDWNNGLLNREADLVIPRLAVSAFPHLARKLDRLAPMVYASEIVNDGLGMLVPTATLLSDENEHSVIWWAEKMTRVLMERHWKPLFFPEGMVLDGRVDLAQFRVIVVPPSPLLTDGMPERLLSWVDAGGSLVWLHDCGDLDGLVAGKPSAFRSGVNELARGKGRMVRVDMHQFNQRNELLHQVIDREYPTRAVHSSARDVELVLRAAGD